MRIEQVNKNAYMTEGEEKPRVSISHAGGHIRLTKEQAYLLCHDVIEHLHENEY